MPCRSRTCRTAPSWPPSPDWRWWCSWRRSSACSQACSSSPEPSGASRRPADRAALGCVFFFPLFLSPSLSHGTLRPVALIHPLEQISQSLDAIGRRVVTNRVTTVLIPACSHPLAVKLSEATDALERVGLGRYEAL